MRRIRTAIVGATLLAALAGRVTRADAATSVDADFVAAVTRADASEIRFARLELTRGSSDEARSFANRMLEDHATLAKKLRALAPVGRADGEPAAADRLVAARLERLRGADFDQQYVLTQVAAHLAAVTVYETEIADGTDARLQTYARMALPTIREHLAVALAATKHIGGDTPLKGAQ